MFGTIWKLGSFPYWPWNFEPSEMGAAFGVQQLDRLDAFIAIRQRHFARYTEFFRARTDRFVAARQTEGLDTAWLCYPLLVRDTAGFHRSDLQEHLDRCNIDTRTVWTGNVTRQPMMHGVRHRQPAAGLPNADRVMASGMVLPASHGNTDDEISYVMRCIDEFAGHV